MKDFGFQPTRKSAKDTRLSPRKAEPVYHATNKPSIKLRSKPQKAGRQSIAESRNNKRLLGISKGWAK